MWKSRRRLLAWFTCLLSATQKNGNSAEPRTRWISCMSGAADALVQKEEGSIFCAPVPTASIYSYKTWTLRLNFFEKVTSWKPSIRVTRQYVHWSGAQAGWIAKSQLHSSVAPTTLLRACSATSGKGSLSLDPGVRESEWVDCAEGPPAYFVVASRGVLSEEWGRRNRFRFQNAWLDKKDGRSKQEFKNRKTGKQGLAISGWRANKYISKRAQVKEHQWCSDFLITCYVMWNEFECENNKFL